MKHDTPATTRNLAVGEIQPRFGRQRQARVAARKIQFEKRDLAGGPIAASLGNDVARQPEQAEVRMA
ncbi:hypothetical protein ACQR0Y_13185 [Bradyrhizobium oligotrophicum]|uniref:hypothetical protein n=1 Tax=Bradyrhizobium oligotrophicum TaxID=44255 RepID=UPI003EB769D3